MDIELLNGKLLIEQLEFPLQNYIVIKPIGEGANAKVFLVHNQILDRNEALKIWLPRKNHIKVDEKRFFAEVKKMHNSQMMIQLLQYIPHINGKIFTIALWNIA
jgi:serine/threonine protein kinase